MSVEVKIGQIWKDRDSRRGNREFIIANMGRAEIPGTEPYVLVRDAGKEKYILIRKDRLLSRKYQYTGRTIDDKHPAGERETPHNDISKTTTVS